MTINDPVFGVLGPLQLRLGERDAAPKGALQRRLLSALVLHANRVVPVDALCEVLWPDRLPADHPAALQTHVFRLRALLPGDMVVRAAGGYRLDVDEDRIDAHRFEAAVLSAASERGTDPVAAVTTLERALGSWRGTPYEDLVGLDDALIESERLTELRRRAVEERFECLLELGRAREVLADLDGYASGQPLRERPQALLMAALRRSGRIADALAVYDRYRRALGEELGVDPSEQLRRLHDDLVTGAGDADDQPEGPPTPRRAGPPRGAGAGVVRHPSSFVGRDELLSTAEELLAEHRLVTLLGTGGAGKTRIAHELATRVEHRYPDGVWFCALAPAESATVVDTVAMALGIEQRGGVEALDRVADVLRHQHALIVLDNCEHVLDDAARLAESMLQLAPTVGVLATSRERLAIDGEHLCPVPPLRLPESASADEPAIRLFVDRGRAVRPDWAPGPEDLHDVAEVCRRVDGLPLAIELAASRLNTMTLAEIAAGLRSRLRLLTGGRRTNSRHRSLAAAIDWSFGLLDDLEQEVFAVVAVFHGPFTARAAAAVTGHSLPVATDVLSTLVERSMLHRDGPRYLMLESMREFGETELVARGLFENARRAHAAHHLDFAHETAASLGEPGDCAALDEIDTSMPDLRVAYQQLSDRGAVGDALELVVALRDYGMYRMRPEVLGWSEETARAAIAAGHDDQLVPEALAIAALGAWKVGDLVRAEELVSEATRRANGQPGRYLADAASTLALIQGDLAESIRWSERLLSDELARDDPKRWFEDGGMVLLAQGYLGLPDVAALAEDYVAAITSDTPVVAAAWAWYAGGEAVLEVDPDLAADRLARAVELARRCGSPFVLGVAGTSYASLLVRHGDAARAVVEYEWVLDHWRRAGVRSLQWTTLRSVVELLTRLGCDRPAAMLLGAVTSTAAGHEVFGEDARRLDVVAAVLDRRLGRAEVSAARAEGAGLDENDAVALALSVFSTWSAEQR